MWPGNLEGAGKPLNLEENPLEASELHMVHKILKDNCYAPYWIVHCPVSQLGRANFDVDDEMNSIIKDIEKLIEY